MADYQDREFTGEALISLAAEIEVAIGKHRAGLTPLGMAITGLCADALERDVTPETPTDE